MLDWHERVLIDERLGLEYLALDFGVAPPATIDLSQMYFSDIVVAGTDRLLILCELLGGTFVRLKLAFLIGTVSVALVTAWY